MEQFLSLFISTIYAAESFLSPVPDDILATFHGSTTQEQQTIQKPYQSFGDISGTKVSSVQEVLGESIEIVPETPTPSPIPSPIPSPTIQTRRAKKTHVTIALLGDSMMDTMGPEAPALKSALSKTFPGTQFTIKNYGVGGTNIEYGIERITNGYTYLGNSIPALSSIQPDIVIIESFGYNPFPFDNAIDKHWLSLATAVDRIHTNIPKAKIVIGATIAPNWNVFGDGAPGISFSAQDKRQRVEIIKSYLENAVKFAKSQKLPLADAYHASLDSSGNGKISYINAGDHIHYSDSGRSLFAQKITGAITANRLLE
jgi:lysophospholipase L1-like esterase